MNTNVDNKNGFSYRTIDVKNTSIGDISKAQHTENVKYQFVCETINNLFGNETTGLCAIEPKNSKNIEIINRAKRVWQAMAYDNGMRIVSSNGKEISVRDMLRKYYQQENNQDSIPTQILSNDTIPDEIKSLFEDLYVSKGLYGMAEMIENDASIAVGRNPNDVISEAMHSYVKDKPDQSMSIDEYDNLCKKGDIQFETAKYLQQKYGFFGGRSGSSYDQRESAKNAQENLLKFLKNSLVIAQGRSEMLNQAEANERT